MSNLWKYGFGQRTEKEDKKAQDAYSTPRDIKTMRLIEYRNKKAEDVTDKEVYPFDHTSNWANNIQENAFKKGFDAAVALKLPVKFYEWMKDNYHNPPDIDATTDFYKYWIDNILKIEI